MVKPRNLSEARRCYAGIRRQMTELFPRSNIDLFNVVAKWNKDEGRYVVAKVLLKANGRTIWQQGVFLN